MWPKKKLIESISPEIDPTSLGNILVEMHLITNEQLIILVIDFEDYKKQEQLLGQFLLRQKVITETQLEIALIRQQMLRGKVDQKSVQRIISLTIHSDERVSNSLTGLVTAVGAKNHGIR